MDPDQLEFAAIHDHGGLTDNPSPSGDDSWPRALLRCGWDLSRKAAIAGAVATAAPLVAPPLIVLSAAGVVLSIPFAAYLAGLAGTNRLMGALLPSSPERPYHASDQGDHNHVEEEFVDASEEYGQEAPAFGHWDTTEDDTVRVENQSGGSSSLQLSPDHGVSEAPVPALGDDDNVVQQQGEGEFSAHNLGQDLLVSNSGDKQEEPTTIDQNESAEYMPQQDFAASDSSVPVFDDEENVVQIKEKVEVAVQRVVEEQFSISTDLVTGEVADVQVDIVATVASEGEELPLNNLEVLDSLADLVMEEVLDTDVDIVAALEPQNDVLPPSNLAVCDSPADHVAREIVDVQVGLVESESPTIELLPANLATVEETAHDVDIVGITVMEDVVRDFGDDKELEERHFFSVGSMVSVHDGKKMHSGSTPYVSVISSEMVEHPNESTGEILGRKVATGCEPRYTEQQLREQLDVIRTITGYGAEPFSTLEDELAGLYIFVGTEFPVSARDTSDRLVELNAKLHFLKSIIGVK